VVLKRARPLIVLAIVLLVLIAPRRINELAFGHEMAAEKAITTIHTVEGLYYSEHGRYAATLEQLGLNATALTGGNATIVLGRTPPGYSVTARPTPPGKRALYWDQSDQNEPLLADPVLGR
jgi:hypothetical protein